MSRTVSDEQLRLLISYWESIRRSTGFLLDPSTGVLLEQNVSALEELAGRRIKGGNKSVPNK